MRLAFYDGPAADSANSNTLFDKGIEFEQGLCGGGYESRYVHAEFVFDEIGLCAPAMVLPPGVALPPAIQAGDANGSLCYSSSPRDGGVRFKWIDLTDGKWAVVKLGALDDFQLRRALSFCQTRVGMKYDWLAILGFVVRFGEHENNKRFCSDACVELIQNPAVATVVPQRVAQGVMPLVRWRTNPARLFRAVAAIGAPPAMRPVDLQGARG
jgi:hypothetical protein